MSVQRSGTRMRLVKPRFHESQPLVSLTPANGVLGVSWPAMEACFLLGVGQQG